MKNKIYLLLQAAVCIALAALLSFSAVRIYQEGSTRKATHPMESIYTPEAVTEQLAAIAPLFYAGLGLLIAGLIFGIRDENAEKPLKEKELKSKGIPSGTESPVSPKRTGILQAILIVAAITFIIAGVLNGSALDVLYKAITICTECVGLG